MKSWIFAAALLCAVAACGPKDDEKKATTGNRLAGDWAMQIAGWCDAGVLTLHAVDHGDGKESATGTWDCGAGRSGQASGTVASCNSLSVAFTAPPSTAFTVNGAVADDGSLHGTTTGGDADGVRFSATRRSAALVEETAAALTAPCAP